jgi:uncharacterized protein YacL
LKPTSIVSALIVLSCACLGGLVGHLVLPGGVLWLIFAAGGLAGGFAIRALLSIWLAAEAHAVVGGAAGTLLGGFLALLIQLGIYRGIEKPELSVAVFLCLLLVLSAIGLQLGSSKAGEFSGTAEPSKSRNRKTLGILDTSVIIDGRIADVCETGFVDGDLIIPHFVLKELQAIADSSESTKRTRGRRGLDILNKIRKQSYVKIILDDTDYPSIKEVDQKLISMAKETGCAILTNDFNLNKVAEVHSIQVLNINQLANALKPIVLPGENMRVQIMKEGKEHSQGIAYLDDGTMVVIDNGRKQMGRTVDVTVTSVLQTTAGRMIFAVIKA